VPRDAGREVLMVKHRRRDGTEYWQFPGGGILPGEDPETAVLRELREETGLGGRVERLVFQIPYKFGTSTTYLVQVDTAAEPRLGHDPEEIDADHRKLVAVAWRRLEDLPDNPEIKALTAALGPSLEQGRTPA
jgi:8-oxo-dGTP pyrophosphatase MutT (NUDIX family)